MWFDGQRQPDTVYVASISRGKDSTAMLRAIQIMNWPLDMIIEGKIVIGRQFRWKQVMQIRIMRRITKMVSDYNARPGR